MSINSKLVNPHLDGAPFFWEGGSVGVLLSHGFTATSAEVRPLAQMLQTAGYTVAAPLLPGHGTVPEDLNATTWQDWATAYERVFDQLRQKCDKVVIGGESLGGLLTLHMAISHPEAAAILCYAPALRTSSLPIRLFAELIKRWVPMQAKPMKPDGATILWQGYDQNPVAAATQLFQLQAQVNRKLGNIRQPLLIIQGKQDKTVYPDVPDTIAKRVNSETVEIHWMEHSGHCVILDVERAAVGEITIQFLKKYVDMA